MNLGRRVFADQHDVVTRIDIGDLAFGKERVSSRAAIGQSIIQQAKLTPVVSWLSRSLTLFVHDGNERDAVHQHRIQHLDQRRFLPNLTQPVQTAKPLDVRKGNHKATGRAA